MYNVTKKAILHTKNWNNKKKVWKEFNVYALVDICILWFIVVFYYYYFIIIILLFNKLKRESVFVT